MKNKNRYRDKGNPPYTCGFCKYVTTVNRVDEQGNKKLITICKKLTDFNTPANECAVNIFGTCSEFTKINE